VEQPWYPNWTFKKTFKNFNLSVRLKQPNYLDVCHTGSRDRDAARREDLEGGFGFAKLVCHSRMNFWLIAEKIIKIQNCNIFEPLKAHLVMIKF
jgi:hypothetical protein